MDVGARDVALWIEIQGEVIRWTSTKSILVVIFRSAPGSLVTCSAKSSPSYHVELRNGRKLAKISACDTRERKLLCVLRPGRKTTEVDCHRSLYNPGALFSGGTGSPKWLERG